MSMMKKRMEDASHIGHTLQDLSTVGGGESPLKHWSLKKDLEGWREVLLPLHSLLKWDKPYYPGIIVGTTTLLFALLWYTAISALTTISLICIFVGLVDFIVPFLGPTVTGYKNWTAKEEMQFQTICEHIGNICQDIMDVCKGLSAMRRENAKAFFIIVMGMLSMMAWIGNLIDNLLLTFFIVNFICLLPGLRQQQTVNQYLQRVVNVINKLKASAGKIKIN